MLEHQRIFHSSFLILNSALMQNYTCLVGELHVCRGHFTRVSLAKLTWMGSPHRGGVRGGLEGVLGSFSFHAANVRHYHCGLRIFGQLFSTPFLTFSFWLFLILVCCSVAVVAVRFRVTHILKLCFILYILCNDKKITWDDFNHTLISSCSPLEEPHSLNLFSLLCFHFMDY